MEDDLPLFFKISLAEWSLHKELRKGVMTNLDFPGIAKNRYGIGAIEFVNQFFMDKAEDTGYLHELKSECNQQGVHCHLIMVDGEGELDDPNPAHRQIAITNHHKWVRAASYLSCSSIRVNIKSSGDAEIVKVSAIDGLRRLCAYASEFGINVIVENHWGHSSNGKWITGVIRSVDCLNCGTLPDLGNFDTYDRYLGVEEMMPFAKGVSAKANNFDDQGKETVIDYVRMLKIVKQARFDGYIGIEYEGEVLNEEDGIKATKALLLKVGRVL